jgi:hypothetical protein
MNIEVSPANAPSISVIRRSILNIIAATAIFAPQLHAGTVITNNLPANFAIINIDARADGSASYNSDQALWYRPFTTSTNLLQYTVQAGSYNFRVINPADAARLFPALTPQQTNQMFTAWTFNSPWATDYLVFDSAAATNNTMPQLFDGAFSNTNGGPGNWSFYPNSDAAYNAAVSDGFAGLIRTAASGGRDSSNFSSVYRFPTNSTLIFAVPDNGVSDNSGGVSVLVSPAGRPTGPALFIEAVPPASVRLLWPTNDPDFRLQFTTDLANSIWVSASSLPLVAGTNNLVTNAVTGTRKFYRLIKP